MLALLARAEQALGAALDSGRYQGVAAALVQKREQVLARAQALRATMAAAAAASAQPLAPSQVRQGRLPLRLCGQPAAAAVKQP